MAGDGAATQKSADNEVASRLASFAAGCLGAATAAKAGSRLGLMGSASQEEFTEVLHHMEALARQRAAKLAGTATALAAGDETSSVAGTPSCTVAFERALCEACGEPSLDATGIFMRLPRDDTGRADLVRVFGMSPKASAPTDASEKTTASSGGAASSFAAFSADYVESAQDLPAFDGEWQEVEQHLLKQADEGSWSIDAAALNALRSALVGEAELKVKVTEELLTAMAQRCGSRRPALSKTALRALLELSNRQGSQSGWLQAVGAVVAGCLAAIRVTKVAARLAETTLASVVRRVAADTSPSQAAQALASGISEEVSSKSAFPAGVAAALRVVAPLLPALAIASSPGMIGSAEAAASAESLTKLAEDTLANRRLSPAFAEARAILRVLKQHKEKSAKNSDEAKTASESADKVSNQIPN